MKCVDRTGAERVEGPQKLRLFSNDCTQIVSGSQDKSVLVWDALTGVEMKELKGHTGSVDSVAFSSDGAWIVSGSEDKSVRVWDVSTGVELNRGATVARSIQSLFRAMIRRLCPALVTSLGMRQQVWN